MWNDLVTCMLLFRPFFLFTIGVTLVLALFSLFFCRGLSLCAKRMRYYGLFYALSPKGLAQLSLGLLQLLFLLSCLLFQVELEAPHAFLFAALCLSFHLLDFHPGAALFGLLNTGVLYAALLAQNVLTAYLRQVRFEWSILVVSLLLATFTIQYALYFFIKNTSALLEKRAPRRNRHA